jgi:hypothetical protein
MGGTVYGRRRDEWELYGAVTAAASTLRGRLEALNQQAHLGPHDERDVRQVRAELFRAHGWEAR